MHLHINKKHFCPDLVPEYIEIFFQCDEKLQKREINPYFIK